MRAGSRLWPLLATLLLFMAMMCPAGADAQQVETSLPISQRFTINLAAGVPQYIGNAATTSNAPQSHWWFQNTNNSTGYSAAGFMESTDTAATWTQVGLPYDANIPRTFINQTSGGGQGSLTGNYNWYRLHFKVDPKYAGQKFMLNVEGSHTGVQVFINGTLLPGTSAVTADAQATHVVGFIPVVVDLTPYIKADGATDNVIAIDVSRGASWYEQPNFSGAFRFGQAMAGLFRNVYLYVTNPVHIPLNVYSNQRTWGTYVGTVSEVPAAEGTATAASAVVEVQTNVLNETATTQQVTLTTQIVDAQGNVIVTAPPVTQSVPAMTPSTFPSGPTPMFQQLITVPSPTLWYPNNSTYGTPYMYKVYHIVSVNGVVVDSAQSPLGIRTLTWDANFPYFNGHAMYLWGGSSRYDYPALGSSVPDEQWWRDMAQIAAQGGNVWRVGHSTSSEELVEAADAYGIMIDQPSGDGEGYWNATSNATADDLTLKQELHRDMIIRDRSHPSILDWEEDNGGMNPTLADELSTLGTQWDNINPRVQADRTYSPAYAYMGECDGAGCEGGIKDQNPNNPAFGAEYWDDMGTGRGLAWDYELAFAAPYLDDWRQGREANAFGIAQWYFADSPGEVSLYAEFQNQPAMVNYVRSLGYSSVDMNRFPRLLYYIYQANWIPYSIQPVVHLAHHWNRAYEYTAGTPIQENAFSNCPAVRLLINGVAKDPVTGAVLADQVPNPWNVNSHADLTQSTTVMPGQVHWIMNWASGTVTAECIDVNGNVVPGVSDTRTTAGAENKIVLSVVPAVKRPDGTSFQWTANGSDAAFVQAEVQDANGNIVPTAADNVTFTVTGPATYMGGSQQYVADPSWTNYYQDAFSEAHSTVINGEPYAFFHAPGDPELNFEGGLQKIALRSTFTPGIVTVTATAPGLTSGSATLSSAAPPTPPQSQPPAIIVPPADTATTVGYRATFTVAASGSGTLTYQWYENGNAVGTNSSTYTTATTTLAQNGDTVTVTITSSFGSVTSSPVTLTVDAAANVAITTQPASQTVVVGQAATLTVVATGSPALNYAWYENGAQVQSSPQASYTTPIFTTTGTASVYVIVSNPLGQIQSATAVVTIAAPTPVSITTQPTSQIVAANLPVQLTATVAGSSPYSYQWQFTPTGGATTILISNTQISSTISYTVPAMSSANVGAYTVTVNNAAKVPVTSAAANLALAPPGINLALDKTATSSSAQNACTNGTTTPPYTGTGCLGPENAVDGLLTTRWGSATAGAPPTPPVAGVDPSWLEVDLGSVQSFNTVYIYWENALAVNYTIQYSTDNVNWSNALVVTGNTGGDGMVDQRNFPTVRGRYIRIYCTLRNGQYGYSIWELQVYNVPQCGGSTERYTVNSSNPNLVTDNLSGLTWTRTIQTDTAPGSQFTGVNAVTYCTGISMRIPTESEALGISGTSYASCAFPGVWSTWTSMVDPNDASETAIVNFDGTTSWNVTNNYPGATLCDSGTAPISAPVIQTQPQSTTVNVGRTATFTVTATGNPTPTYQWSRNSTAITGATAASYTTPVTIATDSGALFGVVVTNSAGSVTSNSATLTVTASNACSAVPSAPAGLMATAASSNAINLSWTAVTPAANCAISSYGVYRSTTNGFTPSVNNLIASPATVTYSDSGLTASTTYYYVVEATDSEGSSPASNQANATTAVNPPAPDFTLGVSSASLTVTTGSSGTETVTVTPENGFSNKSSVMYACSGLPAGGTCSFSSNTLNGAGDMVSTLIINTVAASASVRNKPSLWLQGSALAAIMILFSRKKRRGAQLMLLMASFIGLVLITGCVKPISNSTSPGNSQPTTSTVTVTATAGSLQHSTTFVLTVQPANSSASSASPRSKPVPFHSGLELAGALCFFGRRKRRGAQPILLAASLIGISVLTGCVKPLPSKTPPGNSQPALPTFTLQPEPQTVAVGQTASFTVAATAITPLTYQWQRNGTAIPGATSTIYTTPATVMSDNGTNFSVVVTDAAGSVTSTNALLTVTNPSCGAVPSAPTGLTATATSSIAINLNWTAVTPPANCKIDFYTVYRSTTSGFTPSSGNLIATALTNPGYSDTGLSPSTTYYYIVEAIDDYGTSAASSQVSAETMAGGSCAAVPSTPTGLAAAASSSSAIGLSWIAVTPPANCTISSYSVYRSTTSGFTPASGNLLASGLTSPSYSDTGLSPSTTYYYAVEAADGYGMSAASLQASAETLSNASCTTVPSAPTGLTAAASSSGAIALSWTAVNPPANCAVNSYRVYGSTASGFTPSASTLISSGITGTTYSNSGLTASTTYYYVVEAVDTDGPSPASTQTSATTQSAGSTEIVAIAAGGPAQSNANGGDSPFVADEYFNGGGDNGAVKTTINLTQPGANSAPMGVYQNGRVGVSTYTIPGLAAGAEYAVLLHFAETYFTAAGDREFDVAINGSTVLTNFDVFSSVGQNAALVEEFTATANSNGQIVIALTDGAVNQPLIMGIEIRGIPSACTLVPATPPTGLTATASSPSIIGLNWTGVTPPPNCAITYNLYGSTASGFTPSSANLIASGLTSAIYSNTGLSPSTTYYYAVEAVDAAGASAASTEASAETKPANSCISIPQSAPTGLTATASSSSAIGLSWTAITPPANCANITYNLYSGATSGFTPSATNEIAVGLTGTEFFNTGLTSSTTYYYVVQAADEDGVSAVLSASAKGTTLAPETALSAVATSANEIDLSWPASTATAPVRYLIFRSTTPNFTPSGANQVGTTKSNAYNDVVLAASTTYYYQVEASNPSGTSAPNGPVNATTLALGENPPFWDASNMPTTAPGDAMVFKFLNRTNGQYTDDQITWSATINGVTTTNTIAAQPTFSMPANASGRMYFYLGSVGQNNSDYYDFIEYTIGTTGTAGAYFFNGDTTRVDAFGVKLAFQLACGDGTDIAVGENSATFAENRATTFQRYLNAVPADFLPEAQLYAPYRIIEPGAGGFNTGGPYQDYYTAYIAEIWSSNGLTIPLAGPNGSGLTNYPDLSAAIYRHTAAPGTFNPNGTLISQSMWGNPSAFYQTDPSDHYAQFFHANAINGQQYAFPYDDAGGYSSDVSCNNPATLLVAVGW
ncbi:MAG: fibronectin type III domain-containing protein [Terracidiphilus sp.]